MNSQQFQNFHLPWFLNMIHMCHIDHFLNWNKNPSCLCLLGLFLFLWALWALELLVAVPVAAPARQVKAPRFWQPSSGLSQRVNCHGSIVQNLKNNKGLNMIEYPLKPGTQQIYHTQKTNATRSHPNDTSWKAPAIAWIHASLQDTSQFSHWTPIKQKTPKKPLETTTYSHLNKFSLMFSPIWISCFCTNTNQKVGLPLVPNISKNGHCRTLSHFFSVFLH